MTETTQHLLIRGDARNLSFLPDGCVQCVVTSPPYFGLRNYNVDRQIGLEPTPDEFVAALVGVFREVWRVLAADGTLWLNLGDSYANDGKWGGSTGGKHAAALHCSPIGRNKKYTGFKPKDRMGIPHRVVFALQEDGWFFRDGIIWHKPNPMPEPVKDRTTKAHEMVFLLTKSPQYYYDAEAMSEPATYAGQMRGGSTNRYEQNAAGMDSKVYDTRNARSVWTIKPSVFKEAHFATMPVELAERCIKAGSQVGDIVFDPFVGAGTTAKAAVHLGRRAIGTDLSAEYLRIAQRRIEASYRPLSRLDPAPVAPLAGQLNLFGDAS